MNVIADNNPQVLQELLREAKTANTQLMHRVLDLMPPAAAQRLLKLQEVGYRICIELSVDHNAEWTIAMTAVGPHGVRQQLVTIAEGGATVASVQ